MLSSALAWVLMGLGGCAESPDVGDERDLGERYPQPNSVFAHVPGPGDAEWAQGRVEVPARLKALARPPARRWFSTPGVFELTAQAEQAAHREDYPVAVARLERALRLEPNNGLLWFRLADTELRRGQPAQAEVFARRADGLAGRDRRLHRWVWELITRTREAREDRAGAAQARDQARTWGEKP